MNTSTVIVTPLSEKQIPGQLPTITNENEWGPVQQSGETFKSKKQKYLWDEL